MHSSPRGTTKACATARTPAVVVALVLAAPSLLGQVLGTAPPGAPLSPDAPFTLAMNTATIEGSPVYVAAASPAGAHLRIISGGVRNLANGSAHAATNAETQMLVAGAPNVRLLFTVAEGLYRVVAKRSAGITSPADLRGKRIATPRETSAHYYLVRVLTAAGVREADVTIVDLPRDQMATGMAAGQADALVMWEPEAEKAVAALGGDATLFEHNKIYRELFSMYTTTDVLGNPLRRRELVAGVRAILAATEALRKNPDPHFALIARTVSQSADWVSRSWTHHAFPAALPTRTSGSPDVSRERRGHVRRCKPSSTPVSWPKPVEPCRRQDSKEGTPRP
jgi:sulfonate transport system substrate-binding protein